jgi:prevent-host-death family protein
MITVNMHEAKTRLSELVKAVEDKGETVILCRNGTEVAEIRSIRSKPLDRTRITPDPSLRVKLAPGYDPTEPLSEDEWPSECR